LQLSLETQGIPTALEAVVGIANIQAKRGDYGSALRYLLFSISVSAIIPNTRLQAEGLVSELRQKVTAEEFESAQAFARSNTIEALAKHRSIDRIRCSNSFCPPNCSYLRSAPAWCRARALPWN
jgi:hypothetical protein